MSRAWIPVIILLVFILLSGCTNNQQEEFNDKITVVRVHYQDGQFTTPCIVLTDNGDTYGVDSVTDCIKLENSTALVWRTLSGHITRVKAGEVQRPPAPGYGCPGCPLNFMEFSEDICQRVVPNFTVSDGINTLQCSEVISATRDEKKNIDNLKADAYTQGMIDGRASILEEQSRTGMIKELGVPEGYLSERTEEWRRYADCIAYDIGCQKIDQEVHLQKGFITLSNYTTPITTGGHP